MTVNGIIKGGVSAGTGLTTASFTISTGGKRDFQQTTKHNNAGDFITPNETWVTNYYRCTYVQTGSGNMEIPSGSNYFYSFTNNLGYTITATKVCYCCGPNSKTFINNGTINTNVANRFFVIGADYNIAGSEITIGANGDFTGIGSIYFNTLCVGGVTTTLTNNRATAFSFTGVVSTVGTFVNNLLMPAWNWSNADFKIIGPSGFDVATGKRYITAGTLKCKSFTITNLSNDPYTVDNSVFNPSFEIGGAVTFTPGTGQIIWNRGTGSVTLNDGNANIDFTGQTIGDLIINCTGTKTNQGAFQCKSYTQVAGTFTPGAYTISVEGNFSAPTGAGAITNTTGSLFKFLGSANINMALQVQAVEFVDGKTYTLSNNTNYSGLITIGNCTINSAGASTLLSSYNAPSNNFYVQHASAVLNINLYLQCAISLSVSSPVTLQAGYDLTFMATNEAAADVTITSTGAVSARTIRIYGVAIAPYYFCKLQKTSGNITATNIYLGFQNASTLGKIYFGNGTHTISGALSIFSGSTVTTSVVSGDTSTINVGGTLDLTRINWIAGTCTLNLTGTSSYNVNFAGNTINALVSNTSGTRTFTGNANISSLSITGGILDLSTYDLINSGLTTLTNANSTLKMGTSSNIGFTTTGITWGVGTLSDLQQGSKITCSGNWIEPVGVVAANTYRGTITLSGNGNISKSNANNIFYSFTQNVGVTTTLIGQSYITGIASLTTAINGTFVSTGYNLRFGVSATGNYTVGSNADFQGTSSVLEFFTAKPSSGTYTNNRATAFSFAGTVIITITTSDNCYMPAWDFSNADIMIYGAASAGLNRYIGAGTLKCKSLTYTHYLNNSFSVNNSTYNPSVLVGGNYIFIPGSGGMTYTKGSGSVTLDGSSGTSNIDIQGKSIGALIFNSAGSTRNVLSDFTCDSISGTVGTLQSNVAGTPRNITILNNSSITAGSIQDIAKVGPTTTPVLNCKGCTNVSGNSRLVFADKATLDNYYFA